MGHLYIHPNQDWVIDAPLITAQVPAAGQRSTPTRAGASAGNAPLNSRLGRRGLALEELAHRNGGDCNQ
jgi:hypothetical protein